MRGDSRTWDIGTGGYDKQTSTDFCAEFVKYRPADQ